MSNKLTVLGSGSCNLLPEKAAASAFIQYNGLSLIYDFGRGAAVRLTELGLKQDDIEHIFISHFHPDHVTDLYPYLHAASWSQIDKRTKDITIYGPVGTRDFLGKMFDVFGWEEMGRGFRVNIYDIDGNVLRIGHQQLELSNLGHSHGLKLGNIAVAGDASLNDELVSLLRGADIGVFDSGHISDEEICLLAVRTQAIKLVCSHQYRKLNETLLNRQAHSAGYTGDIIVASDLMSFEF